MKNLLIIILILLSSCRTQRTTVQSETIVIQQPITQSFITVGWGLGWNTWVTPYWNMGWIWNDPFFNPYWGWYRWNTPFYGPYWGWRTYNWGWNQPLKWNQPLRWNQPIQQSRYLRRNGMVVNSLTLPSRIGYQADVTHQRRTITPSNRRYDSVYPQSRRTVTINGYQSAHPNKKTVQQSPMLQRRNFNITPTQRRGYNENLQPTRRHSLQQNRNNVNRATPQNRNSFDRRSYSPPNRSGYSPTPQRQQMRTAPSRGGSQIRTSPTIRSNRRGNY